MCLNNAFLPSFHFLWDQKFWILCCKNSGWICHERQDRSSPTNAPCVPELGTQKFRRWHDCICTTLCLGWSSWLTLRSRLLREATVGDGT